MRKLFLGLSLLCLSASAIAQPANPDMILTNGKIFTSLSSQPYVQALAIRGDRILATGDDKTIEAMAGPKTVRIDLGGRTVIPGINDAHHHFDIQPVNEVTVDLKPTDPTWAEAKAAITGAIPRSPAHALLVLSIGPAIFADAAIDRDTLDQLAPANPVMLETFTGHGFILNTAALRLYGIAENQPDPMGGRFERDARGRLTGTLREYAGMNIQRHLADAVPSPAAVAELRQTLDEARRNGVTTIQELCAAMAPGRAVSLLEAVPTPVRVRIVRMPGTTPQGRDIDEGKSVPAHPAALITVSGSKWMADGVGIEGTFTPRGAWKIPPAPPFDALFIDLPLTFPKPELTKMLQESLARNEQLLVHVSGYLAAKAMLDAMDATGGVAVWSHRRVRFEHGDGILADLVPRIQQYGIVVVQNPAHLMAIPVPGAAAFERGQPFKSLLAAKIPVALGSDGPFNPYLNIMFATIDANRPSEAMTREQAVIAYTRTAAYAEFQEDEKGTIEPGKLADITVLSQDIFTIPTANMPRTESVLTLVGGNVVYKTGVLGAK